MKKFSFVLVLAVALTSGSKIVAQSPSSESVPCADQPAIGPPVLKLRQPKPDDQPTQEPNTELSKSQPCDTAPPQDSARIEFEGLTAVNESDLRIQLRQRLKPSSRLLTNGELVSEAETVLKEMLSDYGYRHAQVSSRLDRRDSERVVTFVISEGARFTISEIRFQSSRAISEQLLSARMKECLTHFEHYDSTVFRSDTFAYCLQTVTSFERSQGYLEAKFGEPKIQEVGEALIVTITSDEGVLYRLGRVEIEGADHVAEADIRTMLDIQSGDVVNGEKLAKTLFEDLKAKYGEKGFIQYSAEIVPTFHHQAPAMDGVVDIKIYVEEGRRFKIFRISFKGENLPENDLRQLLALRAGEVYNQKLFEESIKRINDTGWFIPVDKDKDVDFRTNEEEGLIDFVIYVMRRPEVSRSDP